jgi:phospholipid N-methyltransferase
MKNQFKFFLNFIKNPIRNASILPSSKTASEAIINGIDFENVHTILELGPGTGCFTEQILKHSKPNTKVILIEIEESYQEILHSKFQDQIILVNENAKDLNKVLKANGVDKVDLIVSGLPFAMPKDIFNDIIEAIKSQTNTGAIFRFFTYMPFIMKPYYKKLPIKKHSFILSNTPPLWVYGVN